MGTRVDFYLQPNEDGTQHTDYPDGTKVVVNVTPPELLGSQQVTSFSITCVFVHTNNANATGYEVFINRNNTGWYSSQTLGPLDRQFTTPNLESEQLYGIRIRTLDDGNSPSDFSPTIWVSTEPSAEIVESTIDSLAWHHYTDITPGDVTGPNARVTAVLDPSGSGATVHKELMLAGQTNVGLEWETQMQITEGMETWFRVFVMVPNNFNWGSGNRVRLAQTRNLGSAGYSGVDYQVNSEAVPPTVPETAPCYQNDVYRWKADAWYNAVEGDWFSSITEAHSNAYCGFWDRFVSRGGTQPVNEWEWKCIEVYTKWSRDTEVGARAVWIDGIRQTGGAPTSGTNAFYRDSTGMILGPTMGATASGGPEELLVSALGTWVGGVPVNQEIYYGWPALAIREAGARNDPLHMSADRFGFPIIGLTKTGTPGPREEWEEEPPPPPPPVDINVPTYADANRWVSPNGSGSRTGLSPNNAWPLETALVSAQPGDIVGLKAGIYTSTRSNSSIEARLGNHWQPDGISGTAANPIIFVAENPAATTWDRSQYTELRSGTSSRHVDGGHAIFGVHGGNGANYFWWVGVYADAMRPDSGIGANQHDGTGVSIWAGYTYGCQMHLCRVYGLTDYGNPFGNGGQNIPSLRLEHAYDMKVTNNVLRHSGSGSNLTAMTWYQVANILFEHNVIGEGAYNFKVKAPDGRHNNYVGAGQDARHIIRYNLFLPPIWGSHVLDFNNRAYHDPSIKSHMYCNIFLHTPDQAISISRADASQYHEVPQGWRIYNNIMYDMGGSNSNAGVMRHAPGPKNKDNIFFNNIAMKMAKSAIVHRWTYDPNGYTIAGLRDAMDFRTNNFYDWGDDLVLNTYNSTPAIDQLATPAGWDAAFGRATDVRMRWDNPNFVNPSNDPATMDWHLQPGGDAHTWGRDIMGTFGPVNGVVPLGVYPTGTEHIGILGLTFAQMTQEPS